MESHIVVPPSEDARKKAQEKRYAYWHSAFLSHTCPNTIRTSACNSHVPAQPQNHSKTHQTHINTQTNHASITSSSSACQRHAQENVKEVNDSKLGQILENLMELYSNAFTSEHPKPKRHKYNPKATVGHKHHIILLLQLERNTHDGLM